MRISSDYYMIVDLEATCSEDGSVPRDEMETIEIGAVMVNAVTFETAGEFQTFIKPVRHPRLTPFCRELTSITDAEVAGAPVFPAVLNAMVDWMRCFQNPLFCSWGDYDRKQIEQDCHFHGIRYPFEGHLNLKARFAANHKLRRPVGIAGALRHLGLVFEGTHHRGIDDARNIARIVRHVCVGVKSPAPGSDAATTRK